jgi:hypothetical protein
MELILQKWLRLAIQTLNELEWVPLGTETFRCPICEEPEYVGKHRDGCRLAWLVGAKERPVKPTDQPCQHEKVYADHVLASYPPQMPWICKLCGERGLDKEELPNRGDTYDDLMVKFHGRAEALRQGALSPSVFEVVDHVSGKEPK